MSSRGGGGEGGAQPKGVPFFSLQVYKRVDISQVEVDKRVGLSVISYFKEPLIKIFRIDASYGCIISFIRYYVKMAKRLTCRAIYS